MICLLEEKKVTPCQDEVTVTNKGAILNVEWLRSYETNWFLNQPMTKCVDFQKLHFMKRYTNYFFLLLQAIWLLAHRWQKPGLAR